MLTFNVTTKPLLETAAEGYVLFVNQAGESISPLAPLTTIEKAYFPQLKAFLKKHQFEGKAGQQCILTASNKDAIMQFIFVGVGKLDRACHIERELMRRALATAITTLKRHVITSAVFALPTEKLFGIANDELLKQLVITAHMAEYEFITFKTDKPTEPWQCNIVVAVKGDAAKYKASLKQAIIIGTAINKARHWADLPANLMTPTTLSNEAKKVAEAYKLKCTIFGRDKALELGMGGFCAVDVGSDQDGKFAVLEYRATAKEAPTIALCGKGVTFDTGGINLKPTSGIEGMKYDMSGAASVIAMMSIFAQLKPAVNVIGITPMVENMPSGKATRPDDIIICMNGKSVEIKNTDAEGRLILADALCYAEKFYKPDVIIDIATLTGAVQHALGHFYTGVMTKDDVLGKTLCALGQHTGDRAWQLPMDDDYKGANRSDVADVHNNGSSAYYAGTIVGATFLSNFVKTTAWAHLDIAGTAHDVTGVNYVGKGATGASIRLLVEFVMGYKK
jgi:leucyl aminopeptidase